MRGDVEAVTARETDRAGRCQQAWLGGARELIQDCFRSRLTVRQPAATLDGDLSAATL